MTRLDPRIIGTPSLGKLHSSVFSHISQIDDTMVRVWDLALQTEVLISGVEWCQPQLTILDLLFMDEDLMLFGSTSDTKVLQTMMCPSVFTPKVVDLCAGTGSMTIGPMFVGAEVQVSVDHCHLACEHLRLNQHGHVLQRDLLDPSIVQDIFECMDGTQATFIAGYPCQPFSEQGFQRGQADPRAKVFWAVLRIAFLLRAQALIVECVSAAAADVDLQAGLQSLAECLGWTFHGLQLRLEGQWPMLRHRWWCALFPSEWGNKPLSQWGSTDVEVAIDRLLPRWGIFSATEEDDLALTVAEYDDFMDDRYGRSQRILQPSSKCPTLLHSYANTHRPCPCSCRTAPLSESSLLNKGLRGYFVRSSRTSMPRFLHPMEAGLLLGLPLTVKHLRPPRSALCLLGQVASPLQSLWVYTQVLNAASTFVSGLSSINETQVLHRYKLMIKKQIRELFPFDATLQPTTVTLFHQEGVPVQIMSHGAATIANLAQAENMSLDWGKKLHFKSPQGIHKLPTDLIPHEHELVVEVNNIKQSLEKPSGSHMVVINIGEACAVSLITPGSFLFQVLWEHDLPTDHLYVDTAGHIYGPEYKFWNSMTLDVLHMRRFPTLHMDFRPQALNALRRNGQGGGCNSGLDEQAIWTTMREIQDQLDCILVHPRFAAAVLQGKGTTLQLIGKPAPTKDLFLAFLADGHWGLLQGTNAGDAISWTYWDGLRHGLLPQALDLARAISGLLRMDFRGVKCGQVVCQMDDISCGTVAICHMLLSLGLEGTFDETSVAKLHRLLLCRNSKTSWMVGHGPNDTPAALAALLVTKGVPADEAAARSQAAIQKLGLSQVQTALKQTNPWQALKALASKPGATFQFVLSTELQAHINSRASTKHGAHISTDKKAKKINKREGQKAWQLDPKLLRLTAGHFQDPDGDQVDQIDLQDIVSDARGVALCTATEAFPFIEEPKNISTDALALLVIEDIPLAARGKADISSLRFPAVYAPTDDPLLIHGCILQLGDTSVERHMPASSTCQMDISDTSVIKAVLYRDELGDSWSAVIKSPIKCLMQWIPLLRLCNNLRCDHQCGLYHAPVEEPLDNVVHEIWARRFQSYEGKVMEASEADVFQAFLRLTSSVVGQLVRLTVEGVYLEPRASDSKASDPSYAVVWMPGTGRDQALHRLKLTTRGLSLIRLKHRFGIRVMAAHEEKTYAELRPGEDFVQVKVTTIYKIHPLPHGLQRSQLVKLLRHWEWEAKPLQPARGTGDGGAWHVGASTAPPGNILTAYDQDVLITLVKDETVVDKPQPVVGPKRVQTHIVKHSAASSSSQVDPWWNAGTPTMQDPWRITHTSKKESSADPAPSKRIDALADTLATEVRSRIAKEPVPTAIAQDAAAQEQRLQKLEVGMTELRAQGQQFHAWFEETGARLTSQDQYLQQLGQNVAQQQADLACVRAEVQSSSENLHQTVTQSIAMLKTDLASELGNSISTQMDRFESLLFAKVPRKD